MLFNLNVFQFTGRCVKSATLSIAVHTSVQKVFGMFTEMHKLSQWGMQKAGDRYIKLNNTIFIIADEEKFTCIEWRCINPDGTLNYSISFELIAENGYTLLNFSKMNWGVENNTVPDIDWGSLLLIMKAECEKQPAKPVLKIASIF